MTMPTEPRTWGTLAPGVVPRVEAHRPCTVDEHRFAPEALLPSPGGTTVLCGCGQMAARTDDGVSWTFGPS